LHVAHGYCAHSVNTLLLTTYAPDDGLCETETCHVVEGHETGGLEPGIAQEAALVKYIIQVYQHFYFTDS
jgi:hypothetical protein